MEHQAWTTTTQHPLERLGNTSHLHGELVDEYGTLIARQLIDGRSLGRLLPLLLALLRPLRASGAAAPAAAPAHAHAAATAARVVLFFCQQNFEFDFRKSSGVSSAGERMRDA